MTKTAFNDSFHNAVNAIDAGNIDALTKLISENPELLSERFITADEGYFKDPYLLYFIAYNPIRDEKMPASIVAVTKFLIDRLKANNISNLQDQLDYTLGLVVTGRIPRESGLQIELIDLLIDKGASPGTGLGALAHGNIDAAKHLLKRGGKLTLPAAVGLGMMEEFKRLLPSAEEADKLSALTVAAFFGKSDIIAQLLSLDINANGYPDNNGFHSHATALHQAVYSGSLEAVKLLAQAGADLNATDKVYKATPLGWAIHMQSEAGEDQDKKEKYIAIETYLKNAAS